MRQAVLCEGSHTEFLLASVAQIRIQQYAALCVHIDGISAGKMEPLKISVINASLDRDFRLSNSIFLRPSFRQNGIRQIASVFKYRTVKRQRTITLHYGRVCRLVIWVDCGGKRAVLRMFAVII